MKSQLIRACEAMGIAAEARRKGDDNPRNSRETIAHLFFMIEEMNMWPTSGDEAMRKATKAGRWIGRMYRCMEELGADPHVPIEWTNRESRSAARLDVEEGNDLPHEALMMPGL